MLKTLTPNDYVSSDAVQVRERIRWISQGGGFLTLYCMRGEVLVVIPAIIIMGKRRRNGGLILVFVDGNDGGDYRLCWIYTRTI